MKSSHLFQIADIQSINFMLSQTGLKYDNMRFASIKDLQKNRHQRRLNGGERHEQFISTSICSLEGQTLTRVAEERQWH